MTSTTVRLSATVLAASFVWRALVGAPVTPYTVAAALVVAIVLVLLADRWAGFIVERLRL